MNTAQPIATGKPQEKLLEIMYFSAQFPSGEESRGRALLTLHVTETKRHPASLARQALGQPSGAMLSEAESSTAKCKASNLGCRHPEPACIQLSVLNSLLFSRPTTPSIFLTTQVTSSFTSLSSPLTASEVEEGKHA